MQTGKLSCNGCDSAVYTARYGQPHEPRPHVRCGALDVIVLMLIGERDTYEGCEIPPECPRHHPAKPPRLQAERK